MAEPGAVRAVLVVDDSLAHRRLISAILTRWGYDVHQAGSGDEALMVLETEAIDLVLSDWVMPGMTGLDLCRIFRAGEVEGYVYFILLTSKSGGEDVAKGLAAGADDFLSKPIDSNELRARIVAGERLVAMQRAVEAKNRELADTLDELRRTHEAIARDLVEARRLQQSLVPDRQRSYPGAEVSLLLQPCGQVGGDLVGAFRVSDSRIGLYSIDVSGHGIASALMTARLAGYLPAGAPEHNLALVPDGAGFAMRPPAEVCALFNRLLISDMATELYFTMAIADVDLATGEVHLAQAGHPHPLLLRRDGATELLGDGGMPIGLIEEAEFGAVSFRLDPGDRLLLHSDGFTETAAPSGEVLEHAGLSRMVAALDQSASPDILDALVWALADFAGDRECDDDLSAVLLDYRGPAAV